MDTIEETRRKRLSILIQEYGSASKLTEALGTVSESQLSQWETASPDYKTGRSRSMNSDSARFIEEKTGKPSGWMDQPVLTEIETLLTAIESLRGLPKDRLLELKDTFPETKKNIYRKKSNGN